MDCYGWEREVTEGPLQTGPEKLGRHGPISWAAGRWGGTGLGTGESKNSM